MKKLGISIVVGLVLIFGGTAAVWGDSQSALEFLNITANQLHLGAIAIEDGAPVIRVNVAIRVNQDSKWILRAQRLDRGKDKLSELARGRREISASALTLAEAEGAQLVNLNFQLEPELLAGAKELAVRFELYRADGRSALASKELKIGYDVPAVVKLRLIPNSGGNIKTFPGDPPIRTQVNLQVFATCPWELRLNLKDPNGMIQNPNLLLQWRINSGGWRRLSQSQTIMFGDPTVNREGWLSLAQEIAFLPGWRVDPRSYLLVMSYEIYPVP